MRPFHQPAGHREDKCHRHICGIFREDTGCVGDGNAALNRRRDVNVVDTISKIGDELELVPRFAQHRYIDAVGYGRHQDVGVFHRFGELALSHGLVVRVEAGVKKFPHTQLDRIGQLACHDDQRLLGFRHLLSIAAIGGTATMKRRFSPH